MKLPNPILMILVVVLAALPASAADLFAAAEPPPGLDPFDDLQILRERFVAVDVASIDRTGVASLVVELFPDRRLEVKPTAVTPTSDGGFVWHGSIPGHPHSLVVLSVQDGVLIGNVTLPPDEQYRIRFRDDGIHVIQQVDPGSYGQEAEPGRVDISPERLRAAAQRPLLDDGSVVDIMVVFTGAALVSEGSKPAMNALIHLAIYETNLSYQHSVIDQRLNLVHLAEVAYTESGNIQTDRNRLRDPADGYMDDVHTWRDRYCADCTVLIVDNGGGYCGIAYIMDPVSTAFEDYAFCVVANECATGYYSFGHELGHIMSARHDWYVDDSTGSPYIYNHAFVNVDDDWRTVMAYNTKCNDSGGYCTRLPYWSNPNVNYGGDAMGVQEGTSTSCTTGNLSNPDCDAENWKTLNNTASTVANFRSQCVAQEDCWMKDTWVDTGAEPDPYTASQSMWLSPYIWCRLDPDPYQLHQHQHEDPEFGQVNYLYVEIHNGNGAISGDLELYWAHAATGLSWPFNWNGIGSQALSMAAGTTEVVEYTWDPPGTGHYCLLARWNSAADPMTYTETNSVNYNTRYNNNIVWKNVTILNDFADGADRAAFIVRQVSDESSLNLLVRLIREEAWFEFGGRLILELDPLLFERWLEGGQQGEGFEVLDENVVEIVGYDAALRNIQLQYMEEAEVKATFISENPEHHGRFRANIVQRAGGEAIGGVRYSLRVRDLSEPSIHGRVANIDDQPLAGVEVSLWRLNVNGDWVPDGAVPTNVHGAYQFIRPPGTYRVCFDDPGGEWESECYSNADDLDDATDIVLESAPVPHVDAQLDRRVAAPDERTPRTLAFTRIHPNPTTGQTTIQYALPAGGAVKLVVYDLAGRQIRTLVDEHQTAGLRTVSWDGRGDDGGRAASGIYLCRLEAAGSIATQRMMMLR